MFKDIWMSFDIDVPKKKFGKLRIFFLFRDLPIGYKSLENWEYFRTPRIF